LAKLPESSWPELGEELARKGVEELHKRFFLYAHGKLSRREMFLVADTIHSMMQGLAPAAETEQVYAIRQDIKEGKV